MTMGQIMAGFPDLLGIPHQLLPVFLVSEIDQLTCYLYAKLYCGVQKNRQSVEMLEYLQLMLRIEESLQHRPQFLFKEK